MENIEIDGTTVENIISSEKLYSYGMTLLAIVLMIACGFAVTKIILKITDKALKKKHRGSDTLYVCKKCHKSSGDNHHSNYVSRCF